MNVIDIVDGNIKGLLGINEELSKSRTKICYSCPLFSNKLGGSCNSKLWLNPTTGDISLNKKDNYFRGCGCIINAKTRLINAKCPAGKW